jgi:uncharacterized pyridoxamine 5'-phosphate oxidase family protein
MRVGDKVYFNYDINKNVYSVVWVNPDKDFEVQLNDGSYVMTSDLSKI